MSTASRFTPVVAFLAILCAHAASAQTQLVRDLIAGGGTSMNSPGFVVRGAAGQVLTGSSSSPDYATRGGFWLDLGQTPTAVGDVPGRPRVLSLSQNHPNPFNPRTTISFAVPVTTHVQLRVYDLAGRLVDELIDEVRTPGVHEQAFAPADLASGVYVYRLRADGVVLQRKLVLLK